VASELDSDERQNGEAQIVLRHKSKEDEGSHGRQMDWEQSSEESMPEVASELIDHSAQLQEHQIQDLVVEECVDEAVFERDRK